MDLIGLTGGIGSGKSTVSSMLRELGATVIDSDEAARAVVEPGMPALADIEAQFGPRVITDGRLDRARLAEVVFADPEARRRLEAITWPRVHEWTMLRVQEAAARGEPRVVLDIPLLFEARDPDDFKSVIVVSAPEPEQIRRLIGRGMAEADARARIASQIPLPEKVRRATHVIDNGGDQDATRRQIERLWAEITASTGSSA